MKNPLRTLILAIALLLPASALAQGDQPPPSSKPATTQPSSAPAASQPAPAPAPTPAPAPQPDEPAAPTTSIEPPPPKVVEKSAPCAGGPIVPDRPSAGTGPDTLGSLRFHVETSFGFAQDESADITSRTFSFPTLLRLGVIDGLEVRLGGDLFAIRTADEQDTKVGPTDLALSFKVRFLRGAGYMPTLGVLAQLSMPTGTDDFSAEAVVPEIDLLAGWSLPAGLGLLVNFGVDVPNASGDNNAFARFVYAVALGYTLPFLAERLGIFVEGYGKVAFDGDFPSFHQLNAGLTALLTPNMQLDLTSQHGLNDEANDLSIALGFSYRL